MRYSDVLLEYKTKDGRNITFSIVEDEEGDNNRGWQIDRINAFVDGKPAGYLKIGYIPRERFNRYYPTIFNWMYQIQGRAVLPHNKKSGDWKTFTPDEKKKMIKELSGQYRYMSSEQEKEINNMSEEQLNEQLVKLGARYNKTYGKQFKEFEEYFVDKPYEDYIRVFDAGEDINPRDRESNERSDQDYKRQGIATALYFKAVDFLAKKGMKMRLSTLRSREGGQAIGDALVKAGLTTPGKSFMHNGEKLTFDYLEPEKVKAYQKQHGLTEELVMERSYDQWMDLISRLEAQANAEGKDPREKALYRKKANDLRAKLDKEHPTQTEPTSDAEPVADYMPDFSKNTPPRKYTRKGGFEPFPFKTGTKYDTRA